MIHYVRTIKYQKYQNGTKKVVLYYQKIGSKIGKFVFYVIKLI